jgi:hypothetical protein
MFNGQCSIFLLVSDFASFWALPRKKYLARQEKFSACAGRKFRFFSLTMQRYEFFIVVQWSRNRRNTNFNNSYKCHAYLFQISDFSFYIAPPPGAELKLYLYNIYTI